MVMSLDSGCLFLDAGYLSLDSRFRNEVQDFRLSRIKDPVSSISMVFRLLESKV